MFSVVDVSMKLKIFTEWGFQKLMTLMILFGSGMTLMIVHKQKKMVENDCNGLRVLEIGKTF